MIRHIVFFSARRAEDVDRIIAGLSILARIPHARRIEIGRNRKTDHFANDMDVVVYGEFDDTAALEAYKAHPLYAEAVRLVRPLRETRVAADIDAGEVHPAAGQS